MFLKLDPNILVEIVLRDLKEKTLDTLNLNSIIYQRCIDDIIMIVPREHIDIFIKVVFNSFHNRLQFILEIENDRCLSFLDLLLKVKNNKIIVDWFYKRRSPTDIFPFYDPTSHKIGSIFSLVNRAIFLSHPRFHQKNIEFVINIFLNNCYPLSLFLIA